MKPWVHSPALRKMCVIPRACYPSPQEENASCHPCSFDPSPEFTDAGGGGITEELQSYTTFQDTPRLIGALVCLRFEGVGIRGAWLLSSFHVTRSWYSYDFEPRKYPRNIFCASNTVDTSHGGREVVEFVKGKMDQEKVHILYSVDTFCLKRRLKNGCERVFYGASLI